MMHYGYGYGMGGWGVLVMAVGMVAFWGLVVAGVVLLVRSLSGQWGGRREPVPPAPPLPPAPTAWGAQQVLAERFARGEIDEQEYRQRLATLQEAGRR